MAPGDAPGVRSWGWGVGAGMQPRSRASGARCRPLPGRSAAALAERGDTDPLLEEKGSRSYLPGISLGYQLASRAARCHCSRATLIQCLLSLPASPVPEPPRFETSDHFVPNRS